jgi:hypothetical protein
LIVIVLRQALDQRVPDFASRAGDQNTLFTHSLLLELNFVVAP